MSHLGIRVSIAVGHLVVVCCCCVLVLLYAPEAKSYNLSLLVERQGPTACPQRAPLSFLVDCCACRIVPESAQGTKSDRGRKA
eukprot:2268718-Amphidinium_carterae.1